MTPTNRAPWPIELTGWLIDRLPTAFAWAIAGTALALVISIALGLPGVGT